jgi:ammonia channel protein AmtB
MMFLIHVGFCTYEVGVSRRKNHMTTLMKNAMVIPVVGVTFYLFGWWLYSAMVNGPGIHRRLVTSPSPSRGRADGRAYGRQARRPADSRADTAYWARLNGVFWAPSCCSLDDRSIVSGSIIERVKSGAFWLIAVMLGSVTWIIDAAWGWHPPAGW